MVFQTFQQNHFLRKLIESFNPTGYFEDKRIKNFSRWYYALEKNLGSSWIKPPKIEDLFCESDDIDLGLRPYRLRTRNWKPDDTYLREEAISLARESRKKVVIADDRALQQERGE